MKVLVFWKFFAGWLSRCRYLQGLRRSRARACLELVSGSLRGACVCGISQVGAACSSTQVPTWQVFPVPANFRKVCRSHTCEASVLVESFVAGQRRCLSGNTKLQREAVAVDSTRHPCNRLCHLPIIANDDIASDDIAIDDLSYSSSLYIR